MNEAPARRITILDVMLFVAVVAMSTFLTRQLVSSWQAPLKSTGLVAFVASTWFALITMLALIPLRLIDRRVPLAGLWRQPGWLACNAAALAVVFGTAQIVAGIQTNRLRDPGFLTTIDWIPTVLNSSISSIPREAALAVAAAWATLALVGGRVLETGWIDRVARFLGLYLLASPVVGLMMAGLGLL